MDSSCLEDMAAELFSLNFKHREQRDKEIDEDMSSKKENYKRVVPTYTWINQI